MEQYKYQEIMSNIRHYSNLRFAMLTVFIAITGGLLTVAYSKSIEISAQILCFNILSFAGVWVSIVFLIFEIALNIYLSGLWSELDADSSLYRHPIRNGW